jgi:hypothetical protein
MVSHEERDRLETLAREMLTAQPNQASPIQAIALCGQSLLPYALPPLTTLMLK